MRTSTLESSSVCREGEREGERIQLATRSHLIVARALRVGQRVLFSVALTKNAVHEARVKGHDSGRRFHLGQKLLPELVGPRVASLEQQQHAGDADDAYAYAYHQSV